MEAEDYSAAGCSFSLMCQEDGTDLEDGFTDGDDGEPRSLYNVAAADDHEDEEYMDQLLSKESSFCCSSSSCSSDAAGEPEPSPSMHSEEWFQRARRATVKWILETRGHFGFLHRTAYLAVAYFDRFCRRRCIDRSVMPWAARLLAVACVSLAAKMEERHAPALSELPAGDGVEFSCASICRMELLVLSTLGWRMAAVTPFDYLPCLSPMLRRGAGAGGVAAALIFSAAQAASVLDYRPSAMAAAAVLAATHGTLTRDALESKMSSLSPSCLLEKEDVYACYSLMLSESSSSSPPAAAAGTKRSSSSCSDSMGAAARTYDSSVHAASFAAAAASNNNKRVRLEPPGVHR